MGCRRDLTPYTLCGDTGFGDEIQLCNDCKKKDPLDEIFVDKPELTLSTAKIRLHKRESEIKKLRSQHQKIKFKLERKVESLEGSLEASGKAVSYWVDKFMRLKTEYDAVEAKDEVKG